MEEEINLGDLFAVLNKRKAVLFFVFILFFSMFFAYVFIKKDSYNYETQIVVGSYYEPNEYYFDRKLIEESIEFDDKVRSIYIPQARKRDDNLDEPSVRVVSKTGSNIFLLSSQGSQGDQKIITDLHQRIFELIERDHGIRLAMSAGVNEEALRTTEGQLEQLLAAEKDKVSGLNEQLAKVTTELSVMDQELAVKLAKLDRIDQVAKADRAVAEATIKLVDAQIEGLLVQEEAIKEQIASVLSQMNKLVARRDSVGQDQGIAALIVGSELSSLEQRLWNLRKELTEGIPSRRLELEERLVNKRSQLDKALARISETRGQKDALTSEVEGARVIGKAKVKRLEDTLISAERGVSPAVARLRLEAHKYKLSLERIEPTKTSFIAKKSSAPVGTSNRIVLVAGFFISIMLALLAGFVLEGLSRVNAAR
ncbi:MAG: Wzz/FepE/Etk N-terminal domain-containing protein [Gammaproteobacteria bacterium]